MPKPRRQAPPSQEGSRIPNEQTSRRRKVPAVPTSIAVVLAVAAAASAARAGSGPLVITERDSGKRIVLSRPGPAFLRLSNRWLWSKPRVRGTAVRLTRVDYKRDPGYKEWEIERRAPGRAIVTSDGAPNCRGCDRPDRDFRVTLVVRR